MNRRAVLSLFAGTPVVTAGCLDRVHGSEDAVRLCRVGITSRHSEPLDGEIRILRDDTLLTERSGEITPAEEGTVGDVETTIQGGMMMPGDEIPEDPGRYQIQMRINGANVEREDAFDTADVNAAHGTIFGLVENRGGNGEERVVFAIGALPHQDGCDH